MGMFTGSKKTKAVGLMAFEKPRRFDAGFYVPAIRIFQLRAHS
jgi:hypothetical protein